MTRSLFHAVLAAAVCAGASPAAAEPEVVVNGEIPRNGVHDIRLQELWRVGGSDEDVLLGSIRNLIRDDAGNVYLLDGQLSRIPVFSPEGEHLRTVGREGEGPGEFQHAADVFFLPGGNLGVVQVFPGRIVMLTPQGVPVGEFPFPEEPGGGFMQVFKGMGNHGKLVVAGSSQKRGDGRRSLQITTLKAYDLQGNELIHYVDESMETQYGDAKFKEPEFTGFERRWTLGEDGRVAASLDFHAYSIQVWDDAGKPVQRIERPEYAPVKRTAEERELFQRFYDGITQWNPGSSFETSPTHETIGRLQFNDDGMLWVQAARGTWRAPEGVLAEFDVYDREGRFDRKVRLCAPGVPGEDAVFLAGERVYVVTRFFDALVASLAAGGRSGGAGEEIAPIEIVAYGFGERTSFTEGD